MVRVRPYLLAETLFEYQMNGAAHHRYLFLFEHLDFYECVRKEYNFFINESPEKTRRQKLSKLYPPQNGKNLI